MRIKSFLCFAIVISSIFVSCDDEAKKLNITSFEKPTITVDPVVVSNQAVRIVLSGAYESSNSNDKISECGFYYYSDNDKESVIKVPASSNNPKFSVDLLLKEYGATYHYKAYITNGLYELVSEEKTFRLLEFKDYVTISNPSIVSSNGGSVILKSELEQADGVNITEKGIIIGTTDKLTIDSIRYQDNTQSSNINVSIGNLTIGSTYYLCSYIKENDYVTYGNTISFIPHTIPAISTVQVSSIDYYSAYSGGFNISGNGLDVLSKGVVWSKSSGPTVENSNIMSFDATDQNDFTCQLTDLDPGTTYYVRAFATNSDGTGYGEELSFNTVALKKATINTSDISDITSSSAVIGGIAISDGGTSVIERGVVLGTVHNPTVDSDNKKTSGAGLGEFSCPFSGLMPGTTYYVRAYAVNSVGVEYGTEKSFTTLITIPTVTTSVAFDITPTSAKLGGNVTATGGAAVTERGIVWDTSENPTVEKNKVASGSGLGEFTVTLSDLSVATTYYARAYAVNSAGVSYGENIQFTTGKVIPTLSTAAVTSITSSSAISGGVITSDGGSEVTSRGVIWSKEKNPTVDLSTKTNEGGGTGTFSSTITGLEPGVTYYIRAYAINSIGTAYGSEVSFKTLATIPSVSTSNATDISSTSAKLGGNVTATGGAAVTERGIVWGTSKNPTVDDNKVASGSGLGEFVVTISDLSIATTYYVRAYAVNSAGVSYGDNIQFTTGKVIPTLSTAAAISITSSSAISGGVITSNGGSEVSSRGVVWSIEKNPTVDLSTKTNDGSGTGSFTSSVTGLQPGTTYYLRAYAINSVGIAYGEEVTFTTDIDLPEVRTSLATSITSTSFSIISTVTSDGGGSVTARGVVWSTGENPTVALTSKTVDGTGTGSYTSRVTDLQPNTVYYVRAYATNAKGTVYGEQISVRTQAKGGTEDVGNEDYTW